MFKHTFEFGTTLIVVTARKKIKESVLDSIFKLLQFIKYDFNHAIHHSSGYVLNDTKLDVPAAVSKEFIHYVEFQTALTKETEGLFNPFTEIEFEDVAKAMEIGEDSITKRKNFVFKTQLMLLPFAIDSVFEILKKSKVQDFLISSNSIFRADNVESWPVDFELEDEVFDDEICGETIGIHFNNSEGQKKEKRHKFAALDEVLEWKYAIFKTSTAVENKKLAEIIQSLVMYSDFKNFAHENSISLAIFNSKDELYFFEPLYSSNR